MAHRSLNTLVFAGFEPNIAATVLSLMGNEGLPEDLRIVRGLNLEPWQNIRSGLMIIGMDPTTDLVRVSQLIQNRTTFWDVAVCIPEVLSYYSVALLAQGAVQVLTHPEDNLEATKNELRSLLRNLSSIQSDAFGLEVADLIQLYGEKRMDKTIRLTGSGCVGSVFLHGGNVMHAETMDEEEGMEAFRRLIGLKNPEIRVHKGCLTDHKTIGMPAMSCLLEGSRQMDEQSISHDSSSTPSTWKKASVPSTAFQNFPPIHSLRRRILNSRHRPTLSPCAKKWIRSKDSSTTSVLIREFAFGR